MQNTVRNDKLPKSQAHSNTNLHEIPKLPGRTLAAVGAHPEGLRFLELRLADMEPSDNLSYQRTR
ncbi:hypothetical protein BDN72DRAFT_498040 [Pluteus cervinus]|uniref:Uncharacterized protein n=1 Tax=Pluteus cervinus TaxID=181527 RepID=A0ACD3A550_9AGAR|nr:hypothetical protein BDN72DRAFT_498040 [Pluteus cervinus]